MKCDESQMIQLRNEFHRGCKNTLSLCKALHILLISEVLKLQDLADFSKNNYIHLTQMLNNKHDYIWTQIQDSPMKSSGMNRMINMFGSVDIPPILDNETMKSLMKVWQTTNLQMATRWIHGRKVDINLDCTRDNLLDWFQKEFKNLDAHSDKKMFFLQKRDILHSVFRRKLQLSSKVPTPALGAVVCVVVMANMPN
ncbi:unnamed protein product [Ambrosiozyma monospora]|uniref:Unnamed protein product n=1 Tax=Ambrosiozyma monospora TaxID=43982 RepID=A0A9W6Z5D1_AMBMO|nr:unnamed protein product [Ambrosiozyma monospora]